MLDYLKLLKRTIVHTMLIVSYVKIGKNLPGTKFIESFSNSIFVEETIRIIY